MQHEMSSIEALNAMMLMITLVHLGNGDSVEEQH